MENLSQMWWLPALIGGVTLIIYFVLSQFYWLKLWLKAICFSFVGLCFLWSLSSFYTQSKKQTLGDLFDAPSTELEASALNGKGTDKVGEVEEIIPEPEEVIIAQSLQEDIEVLFEKEFNPIRNEIKKTIKQLKKKGRSTYVQDSLLIRLDAFEMMVKHRHRSIEGEVIAYKDGQIEKRGFENSISRFRYDVDSLKTAYNINPNLVQKYGLTALKN